MNHANRATVVLDTPPAGRRNGAMPRKVAALVRDSGRVRVAWRQGQEKNEWAR